MDELHDASHPNYHKGWFNILTVYPHALALFALQVSDGNFEHLMLESKDKDTTCNRVNLGMNGGSCSIVSAWAIYLHELISSTCASYKEGECVPKLRFNVVMVFKKNTNSNMITKIMRRL